MSVAAPVVDGLRSHFQTGVTRSYEWRRDMLQRIIDFVDDKEEEMVQAMYEDSGKRDFTARSGDVYFVRGEAKHVLKNLKKWMKPRKAGTPIYLQPAKSYVRSEPLGVVLIIGAWNFPIHLTLGPLVGAIAAGNTVLIKPSEVSPKVAALLAKYAPEYFGDAVKIIEGGVEETTDILEQRFDKILYTGNSHVAKIVSAAAAKHLTPVTLELGGKNPTVIRPDANLEVTANRIVEAKFTNFCGQICVAPDYLMVHSSVYDQLLPLLQEKLVQFFGDDPMNSNTMSRIINGRHVERLKALLEGQEIYYGGEIVESENYVAPTLLVNVDLESPVMQEEIFGPILPVLKYESEAELLRVINRHENPLACYVFTEDRQAAQILFDRVNSGGACINACVIHAGNHNLPFGGVGNSGTQAYHGQYSYDNMSHLRAVVDKSSKVDPAGNYPPFAEKDLATRTKITKFMLSGR